MKHAAPAIAAAVAVIPRQPPPAAGGLPARALVLLLILLTLCLPLPATAGDDSAAPLPLVVYVRDGCPHCAEAKTYLAREAPSWPRITVVYRQVDRDTEARDGLIQSSRLAGVWPPGVPTFVAGGRILVGFGDAEESGRDLRALIDAALADRDARRRGTAGSADTTDVTGAAKASDTTDGDGASRLRPAGAPTVDTALFGTLDPARLGLPLFTLALGLVDGFNPCATWVLLFLLSLLVRLRDRRRMALIAGTFVIASGAVYYAFMAAWLNLFLAVGLSTPLRVALAVLAIVIGAINAKDFFAWKRGPSLSIPERARPGLFTRMRAVMNAERLPAAMVAVAVLAVAVNFVELLCTAGLPAIYTAVLSRQDLDGLAHHAYLGLYILAYGADDALMVGIAVAALSSRKLTEAGGRWLKLLSGLVMLALGALMLWRPEWLA